MAMAQGLGRLGEELGERATNVVWAQWSALGSPAVSKRTPGGVVDPEALVLVSLGLANHEGRLAELLGWCAASASELVSVQRVRNLSVAYPSVVGERLREFAWYAWKHGGDARWRTLGEGAGATGKPARGEGSPRLAGPVGVLLKLRLGLGVGAKADVVCVLLGVSGWHGVRALAEATGYTPRAVRRAAEDLAVGGWIEASPASPVEYRADASRWLPLLGLEAPGPWRHWHQRFALVLAVDAWLRAGGWQGRDAAVVAEEVASLVASHGAAFKWSGVSGPRGDGTPEGYAGAFAEGMNEVVASMEADL